MPDYDLDNIDDPVQTRTLLIEPCGECPEEKIMDINAQKSTTCLERSHRRARSAATE